MYEYEEHRIYPSDKTANAALDTLLSAEGISRDANLEYTVGVYRGEELVATGSIFKNTLRCLAVNSAYQGEGLLNKVVSHLISLQAERGNYHLFLYTKCDKKDIFKDLGFYEIATSDGLAVFMENKKDGFSSYTNRLKASSSASLSAVHAAIIMNANPFTYGHRYLVETAAANCDVLHLFVVSEDVSLVPYSVRYKLIADGVADIPNIVLHNTESYMISSATFPSYFIKDTNDIMLAQAELDVGVFVKIAKSLGITKRFVGEEPFSNVTEIYNKVMLNVLSKNDISLCVVPRKEVDGVAISASQVRLLIHDGKNEELKSLIPKTTYDFLMSEDGKKVIERIKASDDIIHH